MTKRALQVGDPVRTTADAPYDSVPTGATGRVVSIYAKTFPYPVRVVLDDTQSLPYGRLYLADELELIEP